MITTQKPISILLKLSDQNISEIIDIDSGRVEKTFPSKLNSKIPKLYLIMDNNEFVYVGITKQAISARFRYGFKANGKNGYHGYKWKNKSLIKLFIWRFETLTIEQLESIEAELVYSIRKKTGNWPRNQNEIHFNNNFFEAEKIANEILNYISTIT